MLSFMAYNVLKLIKASDYFLTFTFTILFDIEGQYMY